VETLLRLGIGNRGELHGDTLAEREVLRLVDGPHPPFSDETRNPVPVIDDATRSVVGRALTVSSSLHSE
jgi:hypothetical protein